MLKDLFSPKASWTWAIIITGLALFFSNFQLQDESPTGDEHLHLTRGLAYWHAQDTRLSHGHPALGNALQALPSALIEGDYYRQAFRKSGPLYGAFKTADVVAVATKLYARSPAKMRASILRGRRVQSFFFAALLLYLFAWLRRRTRDAPALLGIVFLGLSATTLANVRVATTDFFVMAALLLVTTQALDAVQAKTTRAQKVKLINVGVACGIAASVKYSALLGLIFIVLGVFLCALFPYFTKAVRYQEAIFWRLTKVTKDVILVAVGAMLVVCVVYRFDRTFFSYDDYLKASEPRSQYSAHYRKRLLKEFLPNIPRDLPMPLPYSYVAGIATTRAHAKLGHKTFFKGQVYRKGQKAYFPTLMIVKTPLPVLLFWLSGLGAALALIYRRIRGPKDSQKEISVEGLFIFVVGAGFLYWISKSTINIGFRHALPVTACFTLFALFTTSAFWHRKYARYVLFVLALFTFLSTLRHHPDPVGSFSILVGRDGGMNISVLSDDWGQDTRRFTKYVKKHSLYPMAYEANALGGKYDIKALGKGARLVNCKSPVTEGYAAVHVSRLLRKKGRCYPWMENADEVAVFNDHIAIYKIR